MQYVHIIFEIAHDGSDRVTRCFSDEESAHRVLIELKKQDERIKPEYRGHYHLGSFELETLNE